MYIYRTIFVALTLIIISCSSPPKYFEYPTDSVKANITNIINDERPDKDKITGKYDVGYCQYRLGDDTFNVKPIIILESMLYDKFHGSIESRKVTITKYDILECNEPTGAGPQGVGLSTDGALILGAIGLPTSERRLTCNYQGKFNDVWISGSVYQTFNKDTYNKSLKDLLDECATNAVHSINNLHKSK